MAKAAGNVLTLVTTRGQAEASRMGHGEAGHSRWCIKHPEGAKTFYGTAEQVVVHMKKRMTEQDTAEVKRT